MKTLKKMLLGIAVMMSLVFWLMPTTAVHAEGDYEIEYVKNGFKKTFELDPNEWPQIDLECFRNGGVKNAKIAISNKKILSAKIYKADSVAPGYAWVQIIPKKIGKTKVTITANVNGKKTTCKGTITIVKFQKGFSKLKIDGKNCLKNVNYKDVIINIKPNNETFKLEYKLSPGWKIDSVSMINPDDYTQEDYTAKFKSGVYLQSEAGYHVYLKNTKTKISHLVRILYMY